MTIQTIRFGQMQLIDQIEAAEEPLEDAVLPLNADAEMQEHFKIYTNHEE